MAPPPGLGDGRGYGILLEIEGDDLNVDSRRNSLRAALDVHPEVPRIPIRKIGYIEPVSSSVPVERPDSVKAVEVAAHQFLVLVFGDREKSSGDIPAGTGADD